MAQTKSTGGQTSGNMIRKRTVLLLMAKLLLSMDKSKEQYLILNVNNAYDESIPQSIYENGIYRFIKHKFVNKLYLYIFNFLSPSICQRGRLPGISFLTALMISLVSRSFSFILRSSSVYLLSMSGSIHVTCMSFSICE